jgi:hypothetical protein
MGTIVEQGVSVVIRTSTKLPLPRILLSRYSRTWCLRFYFGVDAHLGGQVERDGEAGLPGGEEVLEARVRFLGGAEAGVLAGGRGTSRPARLG